MNVLTCINILSVWFSCVSLLGSLAIIYSYICIFVYYLYIFFLLGFTQIGQKRRRLMNHEPFGRPKCQFGVGPLKSGTDVLQTRRDSQCVFLLTQSLVN